jgi:hypothetical protein
MFLVLLQGLLITLLKLGTDWKGATMILKKGFPVLLSILLVLAALLGAAGCGGGGTEETSVTSRTTTTGSQTTGTSAVGGETDSVVTGKLYMALKFDVSTLGADSTETDMWEVTIRVATSTDVPGFSNPTKDWIDKQIIAKTDVDMSVFHQGDQITANVKAVTDDPKFKFYVYNVSKK